MNFSKHVSHYDPLIFKDKRGYLKVISEDNSLGIAYKESSSRKGVFRGMHIQMPPYSQVKHIMLLKGQIIDYVLVLDKDSSDYGKIFSKEIKSSERIFTIPQYCAHGYYALKDSVIRYLCIGKYSEENEVSIFEGFQDKDNLIISQKDQEGISLEEAVESFKTIEW